MTSPSTTLIPSEMRHRALAVAARSRLLAHLRGAEEPLGVRELADAVGLHPNTVRDHLRRLIAAGLVVGQVAAPAGRGRPGLRFTADPDAVDDDPGPYRALAAVLADQLASRPDGEEAAVVAGEAWGRSLTADLPPTDTPAAAVDRVVGLLDAAGFAPVTPQQPGEPIQLRRCPFGRLAVGRQPVVCGVHLGLMRGALRELHAPLDAVRLEPFVRPDLCLAHLGGRDDG